LHAPVSPGGGLARKRALPHICRAWTSTRPFTEIPGQPATVALPAFDTKLFITIVTPVGADTGCVTSPACGDAFASLV
jgi:hypothetical protein